MIPHDSEHNKHNGNNRHTWQEEGCYKPCNTLAYNVSHDDIDPAVPYVTL